MAACSRTRPSALIRAVDLSIESAQAQQPVERIAKQDRVRHPNHAEHGQHRPGVLEQVRADDDQTVTKLTVAQRPQRLDPTEPAAELQRPQFIHDKQIARRREFEFRRAPGQGPAAEEPFAHGEIMVGAGPELGQGATLSGAQQLNRNPSLDAVLEDGR